MSSSPTGKILIMGMAESGKSTIISVVAQGKDPNSDELQAYTATLNYERSNTKVRGQNIELFDLGGQVSFLDRFTKSELSEFIFSDVRGMIYVVDSMNFDKLSNSKYYLELAQQRLSEFSPSAALVIFIHKIDLVPQETSEGILKNVRDFFQSGMNQQLIFYETSVFDNSIFKAFNEALTEFTGRTGEKETVESALSVFIKENPKIVEAVQIFSLDDKPMTNLHLPNLNHMAPNKTKKFFELVMNQLASVKSSRVERAIIEDNERMVFFLFLGNGQTMFIIIKKIELTNANQTLGTFYDKLRSFTQYLITLE